MRHKLKALVKEENLDVTPSANYEQCEHQTRNIKLRCRLRASGEGGEYSWEFVVGCAARISKS